MQSDNLWITGIGFFFGFAFGVGCALAVMYSIYSGGYRKGVEESLAEVKSQRYQRALDILDRKRRDREREQSAGQNGQV